MQDVLQSIDTSAQYFQIAMRDGSICSLVGGRMKMTIVEVAHSLSIVNSFNGHIGQYSTAQHSCLVSDLLGGSYCGLMHDGHEAICGDVSTPVKNALNLLGNGVWREFENAIAKRFCHYWE